MCQNIVKQKMAQAIIVEAADGYIRIQIILFFFFACFVFSNKKKIKENGNYIS